MRNIFTFLSGQLIARSSKYRHPDEGPDRVPEIECYRVACSKILTIGSPFAETPESVLRSLQKYFISGHAMLFVTCNDKYPIAHVVSIGSGINWTRVRQTAQYRYVFRLRPLQSLLQNRVTCPWTEWAAFSARTAPAEDSVREGC